jgi:isoleucyl-tRNA synthetase
MSKSFPELVIDPEDLIYGSEKLDGTRKHGFGTDAIRLWAVQHDGDKNFQLSKDDLQNSSQQLKIFRQVSRQILGNLNDYEPINFSALSIVDKMMLVEVL